YLSDPHKARSQTGYVFLNGGTAISWRSQKQTLVATSSNHAEVIALYEASRECVWLRSMTQLILTSCKLEKDRNPTLIYEDNSACVSQMKEGYVKSDRTKHIPPRFFSYTQDLIKDNQVEMRYVQSSKNSADLFTKALPTAIFRKHIHNIGMRHVRRMFLTRQYSKVELQFEKLSSKGECYENMENINVPRCARKRFYQRPDGVFGDQSLQVSKKHKTEDSETLPCWGSNLLEDQWKLDLGVVELLGGLPLAKLSGNGSGLDDLDARVTDSVTRSHFSVHLLDGTVEGGVSVLLVHVVVTGPGLVPQPDAVVLDGCWVLLEDLQECESKPVRYRYNYSNREAMYTTKILHKLQQI
ncbi:retrovirus-related pol polyprotein from transposon TNT 1-94, partial [Tanacetum coccineum]